MIDKISPLGLMTVAFNSTMLTSEVKVTDINQTVLDIYIEPARNRHHIENGTFNMTALNLTWEATRFEGSELDI